MLYLINFDNFEKNKVIKNINDFIKSLNEIHILQNKNDSNTIDREINNFLNDPLRKENFKFARNGMFIGSSNYDLYFNSDTYIKSLIPQDNIFFDMILKSLNFISDNEIIINNSMDMKEVGGLKNTIERLKSENIT